ncbi:IS481 family transposase [Mycobacteroides abscessus]|uniref:IS481 family transposase n=2 Tax=Mycobacteroides abscessus TaxID=36809 RepID=UPI0009A7B7CF|nr:IS481 family transposase [Mycobacteroides abscessus]MBN7435546.1 IS481 family transposase [Mycobacteroides abscessus subsp. abscessus]MBN7441380.1 IS481 family transposase [Mycobacteroides abscessus subsp. abscessus]MDM2495237.1 IS481 family transposase [Mycobacteroides abscessus]MDM2514814.1 IS481 family transposase [Mycobacteroides abscessus]MDM2522350.1 IS481 family transposase [Mycobacteroides abscessus]
MRELSVVEQRYQAVLAVISDGLSISQVASKVGVSRQTLHVWLARYEAQGLDGLADRSHRPRRCPHQMPAQVEAAVLELRRSRPYWGPRRLVFELAKRKVAPLPSASAVYRALLRAGLIDPSLRDRRSRKWKRWERGVPMELWQMDVVGGFPLADGASAKALTGIDDHSRMCVCARLMTRERTRAVCDGLIDAIATYGVPQQILTDNGKVFTGRFNHPPVEVLFDAICRRHGIEHLLTAPRSPTTTGKIERFHRSLRAEFLAQVQPFANLKVAQQALDAWVHAYNTVRPHQSLQMATPAQRFTAGTPVSPAVTTPTATDERGGRDWVSRTVTTNGVVCVSWQQVSVGRHHAGSRCDVHVDGDLLRFWIGDNLVKTAPKTSTGEVRNKKACRTREQA